MFKELEKEKQKVVEVEETKESYEVSEKAKKRVGVLNKVLLTGIIIVSVYAAYKLGYNYVIKNFKWDNVKTKDQKEELLEDDASLNEQPDTTVAVAEDYAYRGSLGGSFIDDHNQELYISGKSKVSAVDKGATYSNRSTKKSSNSSNPTTNVTPTEAPTNEYPDHDIYNDPFAPEYNNPYSDPNYDPGYTPENPGGEDVGEPLPPVVAPSYEGYVMKKLNYSEDGFWYSFYFSGDQIIVNSDDLSMMDESLMDPNNSNIYGLSSEKTRTGWIYVRDNNEDDQFLDSCDNLDAQINAQIDEQKRIRREANSELTVESEGESFRILY